VESWQEPTWIAAISELQAPFLADSKFGLMLTKTRRILWVYCKNCPTGSLLSSDVVSQTLWKI